MGTGIVLRRVGARRPSEHYAGHFSQTPSPLSVFAAGLIDGVSVTLSDQLDVMPNGPKGNFAQFAVVDTSVAGDRAFVVAFLARTAADLDTTPNNRDERGTPLLLDDFHVGAVWEAYNCHIVDFQVYSREELYGNQWPAL